VPNEAERTSNECSVDGKLSVGVEADNDDFDSLVSDEDEVVFVDDDDEGDVDDGGDEFTVVEGDCDAVLGLVAVISFEASVFDICCLLYLSISLSFAISLLWCLLVAPPPPL